MCTTDIANGNNSYEGSRLFTVGRKQPVRTPSCSGVSIANCQLRTADYTCPPETRMVVHTHTHTHTHTHETLNTCSADGRIVLPSVIFIAFVSLNRGILC